MIIIFRKERGKIRIKLRYFLTSIIFLIVFIAYLVLSLRQSNVQISSLHETVSNQEQTMHTQNDTINQQKSDIQQKEQTIENQQSTIQQQQIKINDLETEVFNFKSQLLSTQTQLSNVTYYYNIAKNFEDRTDQGIDLSKAYQLLVQYDKVVPQVTKISGSYPTATFATANDTEIWNRAKNIYDWMGDNFKYCSDKALCVSGNCWDFQFYSPNELVSGENIVLCGDCDDHAQLFAGMMYASGVSHNKVRVECGSVPQGGHCWNSVYVNNQWYRVDTVCANPTEYKLFFRISILIPSISFPSSFSNVGCFSYYNSSIWYKPEGYAKV